jgi:hypothetical protein
MNLRTCFNWKVLVGAGIVVLALVAFAPNLIWAAVPFLLLLLCPLMMFFMMRGMGGMGSMGSGRTDTSATDAGDLPVPHGTRAERLAELKARNDTLAREIAALEDEETTAQAAPSVSAPTGTPRDRTGVPA